MVKTESKDVKVPNLEDMEWEEQGNNEYWKPQKIEDELTGVIVHIEEHEEYGKTYQVKTAEGEDWKTPYHRVLQDRMKEVAPGDIVKIIYKGSEASGKGNHVQIYKVYKAKND